MIVLFIVLMIMLLWFDYYINRRIISVVSVICLPYVLLIPMNNFFLTKIGYYYISDEVIIMISGGLICISVGSIIANVINNREKKGEFTNSHRALLEYYKIDKMIKYSIFVLVTVTGRLVYVVFRHGISFLPTEEFAGMLLTGPLGHIFLTIFPIVPILFYYWLNNKEQKLVLMIVLYSVILVFMTFVKYHVIGLVVTTYLFVALEDQKYVKKGAILVIAGAIGLFLTNYLLSFFIKGTHTKLTSNYYLGHLWNYMSGSLIYDNLIFSQGIRTGVSILNKLGTFISPPLNIFLSAFDIHLFQHHALPFRLVATNGERGNVVDAIGYLFPSKGDVVDIIGFGFVLIVLGFLFTVIYNRSMKKKNVLHVNTCLFLTFFAFFSFFGTFYIHLVPWEIIFWGYLIPRLFDRRTKIKF